MNEERRLLERVMYRIPSLVISEHDLDLVDEIKELLAQPEQENLELVRKLGFEAGYLLAIKECSKTLSAYLV